MNDEYGPGEHFTLAPMTTIAHVDGTSGTVDLSASGTYPGYYPGSDQPGPQPWRLDSGCLVAGGQYTAYTADPVIQRGEVGSLCLLDHGPLPFGSGVVTRGPTRVHVVEEHGRWFVSPIGTALDYVDHWIANFDDGTLATLPHEPLLAPVR